jgi:hypothetical protein
MLNTSQPKTLPVLVHLSTKRPVRLTPSVPFGPAAHLPGEALLDARMEVVVPVRVAGVLGDVKLLDLSDGQAVVVALGVIWLNVQDYAGKCSWIVVHSKVESVM